MGMPITNYKIVSALAGAERTRESEGIRKALAGFTMVAIILHRPRADAALDAELQREFGNLDKQTGKHLLFFALTEAGEGWRAAAEERPYYRAIQEVFPYARVSHPAWRDGDAAALTLAQWLGIPGDALPCVIFTSNLEDREFGWMQTAPRVLKEQLLELGERATAFSPGVQRQRSMSHGSSHLEEMQVRLDRIARNLSGGLQYGDISLADSVLDVMAVGTTDGNRYSKRTELAMQHIRHVERIIRDMRESDRPDTEQLAKILFRLAKVLAYECSPPEQESDDWRDWQPDARAALTTARKLLRSHARDPHFDWSTVVVSIAKAMEIEANASIVQLVRKHLGAEMPAYYRRFVPDVDMKVQSGPEVIDLNAKRGGHWAPITLGTTAHLLNHPKAKEASAVAAERCPDPTSKLAALSKLLHELTPLRNRAVHSATAEIESAYQAHKQLHDLAENGGAALLQACKLMTAPQRTY